MTHTANLREHLDTREQTTRALLADVERIRVELAEPRLLGRHMPGWYHWADVETLCRAALRDIQAQRAILDAHEPLDNGSCGTCADGIYSGDPQAYPCATITALITATNAETP